MYRNGVSHIVAQDDLGAMRHAVKWLSFTPARKGAMLPRPISSDTWDRPIAYFPPKGPYDPRWLLAGKEEEDGSFLSGFFDKGTWQETLGGWATSVVVGRGRLGGIAMGAIAVETRTLERVVPADPANPASQEQRIMEAGQVWYPNSAFKTAQAISDFNREGLPLIIFANWRGFSGGQQDMYDQILKYGSYIVDELTAYKQPVFVHIVPNGELRGGAFVVVDSKIHQEGLMELTADETSRGGVLEPEGLVEIKLRAPQQRVLMERLDPKYAELKKAGSDSEATKKLAAREKELSPIFNSIAVAYADAHDRAGRMLSTGVARQALVWADSRRYFYQRLRRRIYEVAFEKRVGEAEPSLTTAQRQETVRSAFQIPADASDAAVADLLERDAAKIDSVVSSLKEQALVAQLLALSPEARARITGKLA